MTTPYQWNSTDYARNSSAQQQWANDLIGKLAIQPGESVLDIGCGDGKVTAELAARAAPGRVVGIDRSYGMVHLAHQTHTPHHPNLRFSQQDAACLGLEESFDVVFSNATLHWVADHPGVLRGVLRAMRPDGRLLFQMGGSGNAAGIVAVLDDMMARPEWRAYFQNFVFPYTFARPEDYRSWLPKGLKLHRAELIPKDMLQAGREGLAGWLRTTWLPYLSRVPEGRRDAFLNELIERYLAIHPLDEAGNAHVAMVRLEVEASR